MPGLRPYQKEAIKEVASHWRECRYDIPESLSPRFRRGVFGGSIVVLPTGTGKTRLATSLIKALRPHDPRPAVFLVHTDELVRQAVGAFEEACPDWIIGVEKAQYRAPENSDVIVASVQTIGRKNSDRLSWLEAVGGPSIFVIDECHHAASEGYILAVERLRGGITGSYVLGITATPHRMDRKVLACENGTTLFERVVYNYPLLTAIRDGWLSPIRGEKIYGGADLSGISSRDGDLEAKALSEAVDTDSRTEVAYANWRLLAGGRITVGFCASVAHAQHCAAYWKEHGEKAEAVWGDMDPATRGVILRAWKAGVIQTVFNCGLLTEGFDYPGISCVLMLRPTKSWALYCQMVGRGTRISPGKDNLLVIDVVDNTGKHELATLPTLVGLPSDFDLEGVELEEAKSRYDDALAGGKDLTDAKSISAVDTAPVPVDLFSESQTPAEVQGRSSLNWLRSPEGYLLSAGRLPDRVINGKEVPGKPLVAYLKKDALDTWQLWAGDKLVEGMCGFEEYPEFSYADSLVTELWPDKKNLMTRTASWRDAPATEPQILFLRKLKVPLSTIEGLSKGQASDMIGQLKAQKRKANK